MLWCESLESSPVYRAQLSSASVVDQKLQLLSGERCQIDDDIVVATVASGTDDSAARFRYVGDVYAWMEKLPPR